MHKSSRIILIATVSICSLILTALVAVPALIMHSLLDNKATYSKLWDAVDFGLPAPDTLTVRTSDGLNINVFTEIPQSPQASIICISGIEKPSVTAFYGHAKLFYDKGIATFLPDVRGHGNSDGDRICVAYQETRDIDAVIDYIETRPELADKPIILVGLSMGGGIAINTMAENPRVSAIVSLSAFSSLEDWLTLYMEQSGLPHFIAVAMKPFIQLDASLKYGVNAWSISPKNAIKSLNGRPALLMHTTEDSNVPFACFTKIMGNAPEGVETLVRAMDEHFVCTDLLAPQNDSLYMNVLMPFIERAAGIDEIKVENHLLTSE